jgi:putative ABC transport system permease protein
MLIQVVLIVCAGGLVAAGLFFASTRGESTLGLQFNPTTVGITLVAVLGLAILTSLVAVRRVLRINPIEATTGAGVKV